MNVQAGGKVNKWLRSVVVALGVTMVVSGCSTVNPYTREDQTAKATSGA